MTPIETLEQREKEIVAAMKPLHEKLRALEWELYEARKALAAVNNNAWNRTSNKP